MYHLYNDNIAYNNYDQCYSGECNLPPSTGTPPSSYFQTSSNSDNASSSLNNYEVNSYCESQVCSNNITSNGYSNSEVHSQVYYPRYGYEPGNIEEYDRCNQISYETSFSTEGSYNFGPKYLQDVNSENKINVFCEKPIYKRNRKTSIRNYSMNYLEEVDNLEVKAKRTRQIYSKHQTNTLENEFKCNNYINKARRAELSRYLSLSEKKIKIWFQNRRTKTKKQLTF
ncbi:hypothetical protein M0802_007350 [Mischocyttarus mexicanus]|nr:hypothetical protein M0802_007350 [Mischocyttarus mexicanus]